MYALLLTKKSVFQKSYFFKHTLNLKKNVIDSVTKICFNPFSFHLLEVHSLGAGMIYEKILVCSMFQSILIDAKMPAMIFDMLDIRAL